ncbi:MAG: hypothetical protein Q9221_001254 [Calogaya cf. arnoldii]
MGSAPLRQQATSIAVAVRTAHTFLVFAPRSAPQVHPFTSATLSVCDDDGPGNGIKVCCDLNRRPEECCKNATETKDLGPPISSVIAGPVRPTSISSGTLTSTRRRTISSSPSSINPSFSSPNPEASTIPEATEKTVSHSNLGAGLGGGLGGAAALLIGIAIFFCWRRRGKQGKGSEDTNHEMDAHDSTYLNNSMLFPAELTEESKPPIGPAELPTKMPPGPYELQGDSTVNVDNQASPTSSNGANIKLQNGPELGDTGPNPDKLAPSVTTPASNSGYLKDAKIGVKRPLAQNRPDSTSSQSGPWHDRFYN